MDFSKFAQYLSDPLVLIGFSLFILYFIFKDFIKEKLASLTKKSSEKFIFRLMNFFLVVVILLILLGFGLKYLEQEKFSKDILQFKKIENLDKKITSFKFNIAEGDSIHLTYKSKKWNFKSSFFIPNNFKVVDLKNSLINHFELSKHIVINSEQFDGLSWNINANHIPIYWLDEYKTLKEVGINNNDVITLDVHPNSIDAAKESTEN